MALYDEARTIPYDTFDYKAECDAYDRASSDWDKFMQAAALAKFASRNGDRRGEEDWLLRALCWADCDSSCMHLPIIAIGTASILVTAWGTTMCPPAWTAGFGESLLGEKALAMTLQRTRRMVPVPLPRPRLRLARRLRRA